MGFPLAIIAFIVLYFIVDISFLNNIDPGTLSGDAAKRFSELGAFGFSRANYAMLAVFVASIILWITEPVPNYLTSLIVILAIVLTGITTDKVAYAQLGHPVMWLNILSFILASMLVKTKVAKRFALWFVLKFGKNASMVIFSFIVINAGFVAVFPLCMILILIGWFVGMKIIFPLKDNEKKPAIEGGMNRLREELNSMGKMKFIWGETLLKWLGYTNGLL